jgi:hypothetical protein
MPDGNNERLPTQPFTASEEASGYLPPEKRFSRKGLWLTDRLRQTPRQPLEDGLQQGKRQSGKGKGATITQKTL